MSEKYDNLECRCKVLGHFVPFKYCRIVQNKLPCSEIMDCWFRIIPVEKFIRNNYSEEEIKQFLAQPKSKINLIMDLIEKNNKDL